MHQLVATRGGFATFRPMVQRCLKWCEYYECASTTTRPLFPRLPVRSLPPNLVEAAEAARCRTVTLLPQPPLLQAGEKAALDDILFQLHAIALGDRSAPQTPLASVVDDLEHQLLDKLAERKKVMLLMADPIDVVYCAILQAIHICVFHTTAFVRREIALFRTFVIDLKRTLNVPRMVEVWKTVASAESLLWVLFVGWATASQLQGDSPGAIEDATWIIEHFFHVLDVLELREEEELLEVLRVFPWTDQAYSAPCKVLWDVHTG